MNTDLSAKPLTIGETLASLALFCMPLAGLLASNAPKWVGIFFVILLWSSIGCAVFMAVRRGFPGWATPYLGFILLPIVFLGCIWCFAALLSSFIQQYSISWGLSGHLLFQALTSGLIWFLVLVVALLLVRVLDYWQRSHRFARRFLDDWTQFSFLLYGGVVLSIVLSFDNYRFDGPVKIICCLCLTLGAWFYLKVSKAGRKRVAGLLVGVTLAFWALALGKWLILPLQDSWSLVTSPGAYRWFVFGGTLAEWGWIVTFMLLPALITRRFASQQVQSIS